MPLRPKKSLMARSLSLVVLVAAAILIGSPASAQFPNIFENLFRVDPPRPPSNIPDQPLPPPGTQRDRPQTGLPPGPPPGRIQQQPLAPPPGSPGVARPGQPPDQRQPPGLPGQQRPPGTPQPANTAPQPGDEIIMEPPAQKITNPTAVFSGLDKITGRIISFEVAVNETVRFGALEVTPRVCYTRPPTLSPNTDAFIEVDELTLQGELRRIFTGWMFAASPGLNAVEHPIYDVWLSDCKGGAASVAEATPEAKPAAAQPQQRPRPPQQAQPRRPAPQAQPLPPPGTSPR